MAVTGAFTGVTTVDDGDNAPEFPINNPKFRHDFDWQGYEWVIL